MTRIDPRKQFSKWLARFGSIIWGVYAFAVLGLIAYRPEAAMACVWLTLIMTCNKALDTVSYTKNSTTEKIILGALERTQLELGLKGYAKSVSGEKKQEGTSDEEDNLSEQGGDNG
jgi:hypothetical protein